MREGWGSITIAAPSTAEFRQFRVDRLERRYPADAVEVVIPEAAVDGAVWRLGPIVRVTGTESVE